MPRGRKKKETVVANEIQQTETNSLPNSKPIPALFFLPTDSIDRDTLEQVKKQIKESDNNQIYLIIRSHGGDAYSAVRIMKHIRTKFKTVIGVVPDYAYSAATLMVLGTNNIFMSPEGYIAPIDKPMEHSPTGEAISALDVTQSISNLASLASQQARSFYEDMRGRNSQMPEPISKKDALDISWRSAVELMKPLIRKIDPVLLQKAYRDLRIGMYYGIDLLGGHMIQDGYKCFEIVRRLVNVYPSHGYAIFREEMKTLGLSVENLDKCQDQEKILEKYNQIKDGIIFVEDLYV